MSASYPPAPPPSPHPLTLFSLSVAIPKDQPILLADGDELGLGDVKLRVRLQKAAANEEIDENNPPAEV